MSGLLHVSSVARASFIALLLFGLSACAQDRLILLPNDDGTSSGAVAVLDPDSGEAKAVVDQANTETNLDGSRFATSSIDPNQISSLYKDLLEGLPQPPALFTLYFEEGKTTVTEESLGQLQTLLDEVKARPGAEVQVTGHTDRVGKVLDNDVLSAKRADGVATMLIEAGLDPNLVIVAGRGEREPEVPTEDEVAEPRNRRVVVTVR